MPHATVRSPGELILTRRCCCVAIQLGLPDRERESDVALEYLRAALGAIDEYLALSPPKELELARSAVYR